MDQSLEVFRDVKINAFCEKIFLGAFLSNRSACVYELVQVT